MPKTPILMNSLMKASWKPLFDLDNYGFPKGTQYCLSKIELAPAMACLGLVPRSWVLQSQHMALIEHIDRTYKLGNVGGGGGIRTHGTLRLSSFQDWRNRPLYHPSGVLAGAGIAHVLRADQAKLFVVVGKSGSKKTPKDR